MKQITKNELIALLIGIVNPTFINMMTVTTVRMRKTGNPYFGQVFKAKIGNYLIGTEYEKRVNNNLDREGKADDFQAEENKVGEHVSKVLLFNKNTQKYYLMHERFDNSVIETRYLHKGNIIEKSVFASFISETNNYENQGLEKTVKVMSVTVDNIKQITVNGTTYAII